MIEWRMLFPMPPGQRTRCRLCDQRGRLRVYEIGQSREIVVLHWQCAAQLLAEILANTIRPADVPGFAACST